MDNNETAPEGEIKPQKTGAEKSKLIGWFKKSLVKNESPLKTELEEIIQEHEGEGNGTTPENTMLRNVLRFDDLRVTDVMTPRLDISAIPADISLDELKSFIREREHTRIPVFDKNLDDVVGFIHIKDLFTYWVTTKEFKLHELLREVLFVPPSMKIHNLLVKMQADRTHMAIVVDEYGGTTGLVTIEDLVEQIVSEIDDEHDEDNQEEFLKLDDDNFEALARIEIRKLEDNLGIKIEKAEESSHYDTLGGLIFSILGKVPKIGESIHHPSGLVFKVVDADKRRIKRIKIQKPLINEA